MKSSHVLYLGREYENFDILSLNVYFFYFEVKVVMVPYIYDFLLVLMLYVLYKSGKEIAKTGTIKSHAGLAAILVYTLNEGLRFGRGIDYNLYGMSYEELERTGESDWDISFRFVAETLISMDIPWQGYVILMSFMFIFATIMVLRAYKDILPYALPLFVLFSNGAVENMVRWYLGFSLVLIGLSFIINHDENESTKEENRKQEDVEENIEEDEFSHEELIKSKRKKAYLKYVFFSIAACTFHLALLPLPFVFYFVYLRKKPFLPPVYVLLIYFGIAYSFKTDFMLQFVNLANNLSMVLGHVSERLEHYGDMADYFLTGGFAGVVFSALPDLQELLFLCIIVLLGYKAVKEAGRLYIYAYNLFILGFCTNPIATQIELMGRFNAPFMFFRAIVLGCILEFIYRKKKVVINRALFLFSILVFLNIGRRSLTAPFKLNQEKFLYIWDSDRRSYQSMYDMWLYDMYNEESKSKKRE